jgi:N-methylhydantoinase B/oxoprolinase/acetone carboxylase alpha subunit
VTSSSSAGYGDPLERDPEFVRDDILDDFTTPEIAREAYGVVFSDERTWEVDAGATERLREELRASRDRVGSLTAYFETHDPKRRPNPVSAAGDREFGKS